MRFGKWRGVPLTFTLAALLGMVAVAARADGWHLHDTLPREVPAYDYTTGGEYYAPPIPYGHYAKDPHGEIAKGVGMVTGPIHGLLGKLGGLGHGNGQGDGCGHGGCGTGGCGHGLGCGSGVGGKGCGFCFGKGLFHGDGCGSGLAGKGCGLFGHGGNALACGDPVTVPGAGIGHKKHFAPCHASTVAATSQVAPAPTAQGVVTAMGQSACGDPGCKIGGIHSHLGNLMNKLHCKFCGGKGCGGCGGLGMGDPCGTCHGGGCNACGGCGLFRKACSLCGGRGCASCLKGLGSKAHGLLGSALGLFHHDKFDYFVGPGGPVPLRPGYVPYIVTTRSPRDYFAFPPMNPDVP